MCTHETVKDGVTVFFYLYAPEICIRVRRVLYAGEPVMLEIAGDRLMLTAPVRVTAGWQKETLYLGDRMLPEEGYQLLKTQAGEEVLLVAAREKPVSLQCGKIAFEKERIITIGTDFRNDIFYEYSAFLRGRKILLYQEGEFCILESRAEMAKAGLSDGKGTEITAGRIYVNGRAAGNKVVLQKGDQVAILGLRLFLIPEMLICTSFYGTLRTAERKEEMMLTERERGLCFKKLKEGSREKGKLHTEELELEQPEPLLREKEQPLFLTIGPSLTLMLPILLMVSISSLWMGQGGNSFYGMTAIMTVTSALLTVFWSLAGRSYRKQSGKRRLIIREKEYLTYLQKTEHYLEQCSKENQRILMQKYPPLEQITQAETGTVFWNAGQGEKEEKWIRLGLGDVPFPMKIKIPGKNRALNRDVLLTAAYEMADKYQLLTSVPAGVFLEAEGSIGFVGNNMASVILQALVQLAAYYSQKEMKLVYFYHEEYREEWEIADCLKWLPQCWQEGRKRRFLAGNEKEAGEILPCLTEKLKNRIEGSEEKEDFYVFVIANQELVRGEGIDTLLTRVQKAGGYYVIFTEKRKEQIPGSVKWLVSREKEGEEIRHQENGVWEVQKVKLEECDRKQGEFYMRQLANAFWGKEGKACDLPEKVSFLDLYDCSRAEELHCLSRWRENEAAERIRVPIGFGSGNRLMCLDIHEKFHGPHGLVAGTTGSGKSELLQTYLLSLAVSFSPQAVNFFIIDYKGGGMGQALCGLPHCAGIVSNLSGRQIRRALLSIKSENTRRQRLFVQAGVSHVDEYAALYREGKVKEPVPHLILVVDEFAELKKEEPAFMQEVISVAQIGRSLGVHLILATQKPAGTIDDKVWSNTRFRLCLRVAEKQDSMDMLRRPEAAYLTSAGRCYMQIGNNERFELLQTGYSKAPYEEEKKKEKAALVSAVGRRDFAVAGKKQVKCSQLEKIVDYVKQTALKASYEKAKKLWMEELPEKLLLHELKPQVEEKIVFCLGRYDDPGRQLQKTLYYRPVEEGHLGLCGMPSTGKTTFLQTILWQLCSSYEPSQILFLSAALDHAGIGGFEQMPHCLGRIKQVRDAESFFYHLERLLQKRKEILGGISFAQYQKKHKGTLPLILFFLDDYGTFRQMTEDRYQPFVEKLAKEGLQCGIYLVITALGTGSGELPGRLHEKMKQMLTLEMSDKVQYGDVLRQYQIPVLPAGNIKGRGLCKVEDRILEFQVPLFSGADDYERAGKIRQLAQALLKKAEKEGCRVQKFPMIPEKPGYQLLEKQWQEQEKQKRSVRILQTEPVRSGKGKEEGEGWKKNLQRPIPLGYLTGSGYMRGISPDEQLPFLISGEKETGKRNVMCCLISGFVHAGYEVAVVDRTGILDERRFQALTVLTEEEDFALWYQDYKQKKEDDSSRKVCLFVSNLADFVQMLVRKEHLTGEAVHEVEENIEQKKILMAAISQPGREAEFAGTFWYELFFRKQCGIHLGGHASRQRLLCFDDLSYAQLDKKEEAGIGYLKRGPGMATEKILIPCFETEGEENDFSGYTDSCP